MVAHHARVFTLPQFAVLAADLLKADVNARGSTVCPGLLLRPGRLREEAVEGTI